MIELQKTVHNEQWDEYILTHGGHPLQLWAWGQVKALHGWKAIRVYASDDEKTVGAAQILIRSLPSPLRAFAYIPRGPVVEADYEAEFLEALAQLVKREYHAVTLSVEPNSREFSAPHKWVHATNKVLPAETILLDLTKPESQLLAEMAKKTRQYIRKSSADVVIRQARSLEDVQACLTLYGQTAKRAGFRLHADSYYLDVFGQLKDHSPIFIAYSGDEPVAFLWLAISATTSYELYGGMNEQGQQLRANYALKWHAIRKVMQWGLTQYDFGGLIAGGVSTFKQGWSKESTVFAGTYDRPLSPLYSLWSHGLPYAKKMVRTVKRIKTQ